MIFNEPIDHMVVLHHSSESTATVLIENEWSMYQMDSVSSNITDDFNSSSSSENEGNNDSVQEEVQKTLNSSYNIINITAFYFAFYGRG